MTKENAIKCFLSERKIEPTDSLVNFLIKLGKTPIKYINLRKFFRYLNSTQIDATIKELLNKEIITEVRDNKEISYYLKQSCILLIRKQQIKETALDMFLYTNGKMRNISILMRKIRYSREKKRKNNF